MEPLIIAVLSFMIGCIVGATVGLRFAAGKFGRAIKSEVAAGHLSKADALRIAELRD